MPGPGTDPDMRGNYFFRLSLGGAEAAGYFKECSGFSSESDIVEYKFSDKQGAPQVVKTPGQIKWQNITLKRGVDKEAALWTWRKEVLDGKYKTCRKDGQIDILDFEGAIVVTFKFMSAWPCKYTAPGVDAGSNEILLEEIELAHEGWERV